MRNLSILLLVILCLSACKKGSNNLPITPASLSGRWIRQSSTSMTYTNGKLTNTATVTFNTTGNSFTNPNIAIYFSAQNIGTYLQPGLSGVPFTYVISGSQLTIDFGSYDTNIPSRYTIKSVTSTQLELVDGTSYGDGTVNDTVYLKD